MQTEICDQKNANFSVKISGIDAIALYDTGVNMSCMTCACYAKLRDSPYLKTIPAMSVHSATGHASYLIGLTCCDITIVKSNFKHTFGVCKWLQKLIIGLDMQH